jgi:ribonuclease HII
MLDAGGPPVHGPSMGKARALADSGGPSRVPRETVPAAPPGAVLRLGIDENGLGPRLGPLIVSAIVARTEGEGHMHALRPPRGSLRKRLDDSKALVSFGDSSLGEAWARAIARATGVGAEATSPDDLVHALSIESRAALRTPCRDDHLEQCWGARGERFLADDALVDTLGRDLARLRARGVHVLGARITIVCAHRLNQGITQGRSRFVSDLHAMERLALHARDEFGAEVEAACGKVGGYDRYADAFGPLAGRLYSTVVEGRARSEYRVAGVGRLAFVRDADQSHMLVCMASLVGKWARDLLMSRVTRFYRADDPELPEASGYHDPVTTRFIRASALTRKKRGILDDCFERRALPDDRAAAD